MAALERILAITYHSFVFLLITSLSFVVSNTWLNPTQTPKTFTFLFGIIAMACFFSVHLVLRRSRNRAQCTVTDIMLFLLFMYILVNLNFLQDVTGFSFRFYELIGLALLYVILRLIHVRMIPWFLLAVTAGGLFQAVYGNLQLYGVFPSWHTGFSLSGSFFNPGPYAGYLVSALPVALGFWLFWNRLGFESGQESGSLFRRKLFVGAGFISAAAILLVLPATQSRAALLAAAAGSGYLVFRRYGGAEFLSGHLNTLAKKGIAFSVAAVILAGSMAAIYSLKKDSTDGRILIWKFTALIIQEQPVFGLGFDRFRARNEVCVMPL
jgi:O-antigen polymerase